VKTQIFATPTDALHSPRAATARGFTLVEVMVVFAIMALVMAVVPVAYGRMQSATQYREVVRGMISGMRVARQQAILTGRDTVFSIDMDQRLYRAEGSRAQPIPENIDVRATVAEGEVADRRFDIRFLPSGGASGGSVDVARASGTGVRLRVDWFSGRVEQEVLLP
jgi:general secretion pathway protein H